ncbi:hypothetical protein B296_00027388, partial [Ensete ventricosum]
MYRYADRPLPGGTMHLPARGRGAASSTNKENEATPRLLTRERGVVLREVRRHL